MPERCSVVLPTYNRASFLPDAIASIRAQSFEDWELVVIDDGSTDGTRERLEELTRDVRQRVRYIAQPNAGVAPARNRGIEVAEGEFIAFFDSDDLWLPHHLHDSIHALDACPEVDWTYAALESVDSRSGARTSDSFRASGIDQPFLSLRTRRCHSLHVFDDPELLRCAILHGLFNGLQASVIRRRLFDDGLRMPVSRVGSDRLFTLRALHRGATLAYFDAVHGTRRIHDDHTSIPSAGAPIEDQIERQRALIRGYEDFAESDPFPPREARALRRRIAEERFWRLGYVRLWQNGRRAEALTEFRAALSTWKWSARMWKTFVLAALRSLFGRGSDLDRQSHRDVG